ncbi:MAG: sulfotransferase domain-containing protein [Kiloniellaceae bacterium]
MPGILWLASYPKSGNTWLRAYLANLFRNPARPIPINELPNFALGDNFLLHYEQFSGRKAEDLSPEDLARLRPKVHEWFATSRGDTVLVKTHNACALVDGAPLITPSATAGAIYVVRNPFDVAVSFASHYQVSAQRAVDLLCDEMHVLPAIPGQLEQLLLSWSSHVRSWTRAPGMRRQVMRYEDMLAKPYRTFAALSQFLGLPEEPQRIKRAIRFSSFRELKKQEEEAGFVEARPDGKARFFRTGKAGGWREALNEAQVRQLIAAHGEVMAEFGYLDPRGNPTV